MRKPTINEPFTKRDKECWAYPILKMVVFPFYWIEFLLMNYFPYRINLIKYYLLKKTKEVLG